MKKSIDLYDFIQSVKADLARASAEAEKSPAFFLEDVEIETEISVVAEGKAGFKLVVDLEGTASGTQSKRVKVRLTPFRPSDPRIASPFKWREDADGNFGAVANHDDPRNPKPHSA